MIYRYILAFGANLGNRRKHCDQGINYLKKKCVIIKKSKFIKTAPLVCSKYPSKNHNFYINSVADVATDLPVNKLYELIVTIEDRLGHSRKDKWLPRCLDIDILFTAFNLSKDFNDCPALGYKKGNFCVPHREVFKRDFLLSLCRGSLGVLNLSKHRYLFK